MRNDTVEDIIMREVAEELGMSLREVRDMVVNGQSAYTKHIIESGTFMNVRWIGLGTFKLRPKYAMVKEHMKGLSPAFKHIFKQRIQNGSVFERKWNTIHDLRLNEDEDIQDR